MLVLENEAQIFNKPTVKSLRIRFSFARRGGEKLFFSRQRLVLNVTIYLAIKDNLIFEIFNRTF